MFNYGHASIVPKLHRFVFDVYSMRSLVQVLGANICVAQTWSSDL